MLALPWLKFAVALGLGLLIGLERERSKGEGPTRRPAGIRTFALTALLGAAAVYLGGAHASRNRHGGRRNIGGVGLFAQ